MVNCKQLAPRVDPRLDKLNLIRIGLFASSPSLSLSSPSASRRFFRIREPPSGLECRPTRPTRPPAYEQPWAYTGRPFEFLCPFPHIFIDISSLRSTYHVRADQIVDAVLPRLHLLSSDSFTSSGLHRLHAFYLPPNLVEPTSTVVTSHLDSFPNSPFTSTIMSSEVNSPTSPHSPAHNRRASFSPGQPLAGFFGRSPSRATATSAFPGPITTAAANAQSRRRMSISTLGLSGNSPTQTSPFASAASRRASISSAGTGSTYLDESVIEEGDGPVVSPTTPLARRMSFGAKALREVRTGVGSGMGNNGRLSTGSTISNPRRLSSLSSSTTFPSSTNKDSQSQQPRSNVRSGRYSGDGFNWSDSFRSRAERAATVSVPLAATTASSATAASTLPRHRAESVNTAPAPMNEVPKAPMVPDAFQERLLKGDFYMD